MTLLHWLLEISECQTDSAEIDFDELDEGVFELRDRLEAFWERHGEPGSAASEEDEETLQAMAELLAGVADALERFGETGLRCELQDAIQYAQDMVALRDGLRQRVEQFYPEFAGDSLA